MKTGLSHPACQSRDTLIGMGICHRLHSSPGDAAASPTEENIGGWGRRCGGLTSRNMLLSQPCWRSNRKNAHGHSQGKSFKRSHKRMAGQIETSR